MSPCYSISASFDDVKGYWLSEEDWPVIGHQVVLIISNNSLQDDKRTEKIVIKKDGDGYIIHFESMKFLGDKVYEDLYDKIIIVNRNTIIREIPTGDGKRKQWIYNRITEEEAQKNLNAPSNHGMNLKPVDDPGF